MEDLIHQLEAQIKLLKQKYERAEQTNAKLRQHVANLNRQKEILLGRNKLAVSQIENIVSRLKTLEKTS